MPGRRALSGGPFLLAQNQIIFEAEGPTKEIPEGNRFEVAFTLKNATAQRFVPPDFKGLRVTSGPTELRSAGFVNGKSYSHQSWTYELEAGTPGTYTIGSAMVQTTSQTLRTQPLVIRVVKPRPGKTRAPAPGSNDRLFLSGELNRETAWVGQQVHYQVKLYTQVGVSNYDILDLPQFEGFFAQERRRFDTRVQYQTIRGKKYAVRILYEMALFPQEAGVLAIGPARVRVGVEPSAGGVRALMNAVPVMLQTQPLTIRINPLPEPAPANFSGGVGIYSWKVTSDKSTLTTDDALTLTVSIEGNGDARRFANPRFVLPDGLEGFEPKAREQEEYETGDQFVHARILEYVILPKQPGEYTLLPELVVFNADSNAYQTLQAEQPVTILVTPGPTFGQESAPIETVATPPAPRSFWEDIWKQTLQQFSAPALGFTFGGLFILAAVLFFWHQKKQRTVVEPTDNGPIPAAERPKPSLRNLRNRLQEVQRLIQQDNPKVFYHELLKAVQASITAGLDTDPALLTKEFMQEHCAARGVPQPTLDTLAQVWQTCEKSVFAGQAADREMLQTWQKADTALQQLDATFK
ncbi:MAG: protein BatD [Lewinellaceae bacterium]|nr:protein BatD [Lewinellaceae bacterium]